MEAGLPEYLLVEGTYIIKVEAPVGAFAELIVARELVLLRLYQARGVLPELMIPNYGSRYCKAAQKALLAKLLLFVEVGRVAVFNRSQYLERCH